ncbi:MAG: hypothetical protein FI707_01505 [SAR202 cluster bacterium]|nr:hypothetical protein [SAR202 cluster bacterium]
MAALPGDIGIRNVPGMGSEPAPDATTRDVHFAVSCDCGASVLLGIEVSLNKTAADITAVMPTIVSVLSDQAKDFRAKTCQEHTLMRMGSTTG